MQYKGLINRAEGIPAFRFFKGFDNYRIADLSNKIIKLFTVGANLRLGYGQLMIKGPLVEQPFIEKGVDNLHRWQGADKVRFQAAAVIGHLPDNGILGDKEGGFFRELFPQGKQLRNKLLPVRDMNQLVPVFGTRTGGLVLIKADDMAPLPGQGAGGAKTGGVIGTGDDDGSKFVGFVG